jgi:hypothetical protein
VRIGIPKCIKFHPELLIDIAFIIRSFPISSDTIAWRAGLVNPLMQELIKLAKIKTHHEPVRSALNKPKDKDVATVREGNRLPACPRVKTLFFGSRSAITPPTKGRRIPGTILTNDKTPNIATEPVNL